MVDQPYLLLDAGGTIIFMDQELLSRLAGEQGVEISPQRFHDEHFRFMYWFDDYLRTHGRYPERLGGSYAQILFEALGMDSDSAARAAERAAEQARPNLWTYTFPWVRNALQQLADLGYRMSIISNADGSVEQKLHDMGMADHFEKVYDSEVVGRQKPDPAIFQLALQELDLSPQDALYVGDLVYVDVLGANRAGIGAVHLDPLDLYGEWPGVHLRNLADLPDWLGENDLADDPPDLWPLAGARVELAGG